MERSLLEKSDCNEDRDTRGVLRFDTAGDNSIGDTELRLDVGKLATGGGGWEEGDGDMSNAGTVHGSSLMRHPSVWSEGDLIVPSTG